MQAGAPSRPRAVPPRTIALLAIGTALLTGLVAWEGNGVAGLALAGSRAVRPPRDWAPLLGLLRWGRPGAWLERSAAVLEKAAPAALLVSARREPGSGDVHPLLRRQLRPAAGADTAGVPGGEAGALPAGRGEAAGSGTGAATAAARQQAAARALPSGRGAAAGGRARGTRSPADAAGALAAALAYTRPNASDDAAGGASAAPAGAAARRAKNGTQQHGGAGGAAAAALGEPATAAAGTGPGASLAPPATHAARGAGGGGQLADPGPDPGRCAFLAASADEPLGPPAGEGNPLCTPLRRPGVRSVAVVGNGPLDEAARRGVGAADVVVRFNLMNNWRRFAERVDVWVIRFSVEAALRYWGITNFRPAEGERVINATQARPAAPARRGPRSRCYCPALVRAGRRPRCALAACRRAGRGRTRALRAAARTGSAGTASASRPVS